MDTLHDADEELYMRMNDNIVAYDGRAQRWCERVGTALIWRKQTPGRNLREEEDYDYAQTKLDAFVRRMGWTPEEQNALAMTMFFGIGPLPEELNELRDCKVSFTLTRLVSYAHYFRGRDWVDNGGKLLVECDTYQGISPMSSDMANNLSFIDHKLNKVRVSGSGENVITGIREKIDGELVCQIRTTNERGIIKHISYGRTVDYSQLSGYGYYELKGEMKYVIAGCVTATPRKTYYLDTVKPDYQEGAVVVVNGCEYKLKNANTYDARVDEQMVASCESGVIIGKVSDPDGIYVGPAYVYEIAEYEHPTIVALRYNRAKAERLAVINAIRSAPELMLLKCFMRSVGLVQSHDFAMVTTPPLYAPEIPNVVSTAWTSTKRLTLRELDNIIEHLTSRGATTVSRVMQIMQNYQVFITVPKLYAFCDLFGYPYKSNVINSAVYRAKYNDKTIRLTDEIVKVVYDRHVIPMYRSLVIMEEGSDHYKPMMVAALIIKPSKLKLFTKSPGATEYDFSAGGLVGISEYPRQALFREMMEELNINVVAGQSDNLIKCKFVDYPYDTMIVHSDRAFAQIYLAIIRVPEDWDISVIGENRNFFWSIDYPTLRHDYYLLAQLLLSYDDKG